MFLTQTNEDFLKKDSGPSQDRILIFSTDSHLDTLATSDHWFADGAFKSQPILFDQLFVIHALQMDGNNVTCVPLVYCLTPNRTTATYNKILGKLKELRPALAPISIMTDFERALLKAFSLCLPTVEQRGCFFHFRQANFRHIQSKWYRQDYNMRIIFAELELLLICCLIWLFDLVFKAMLICWTCTRMSPSHFI
jgi:hypothetical protein